MKIKNNSFYIDNYNLDKYCRLTPISEIFKNFKPKELKLKPTDLNKNLIQLINQRNKDFVKIYKKTILFEDNKVSNNLIINKNKKLKKHHYFPSDNYTNILKKEKNNNLIENIKPIKNKNNYEEKIIKNNIYSNSFTNFDNKNKKKLKKNNEEMKSNFINKQNNDKFFLTSFNQYKNNLLSNSKSLYLKKNIKLSLKKNNHRSRNIKNINSKDNSNNDDNFLSADNKSFKSLSELFFNSNINKYHTKNYSNENISVSNELKNLENVNNKTQNKLNKIINKWFYIPLLTPSFENDVKDIINKKFLLNNGQYKLESLDKLNIKDTIKNYWKYKKFKHNIYSLQYKNNGMIQNLESKIKKDLIRCESRKIEIKFGTIKNNKIFERLLQKNTKPIHLRKIDKSLLLNKNINSNLNKYSKTFEKFYKSQ